MDSKKIFGTALRGDKTIWMVFILLCVVSFLEVYSASSTLAYKGNSFWGPMLLHTGYVIVGFLSVVVIQRLPIKSFRFLLFLIPIAIFLLIYIKFAGTVINDAQRSFAIFGITIQPSELAKLSLIIFVAYHLATRTEENETKKFWYIFSLTCVFCLLIVLDNLSTAGLVGIVAFLMMFLGRVKVKLLLITALVVVCLVGTTLMLPRSFTDSLGRFGTWVARIDRFTASEEELSADTYKITDDNYQVSHAKIAIANAGLIGFPGSGTQRDFLPQAYSDFIFAIILEDMGMILGMGVLLLYVILMFRCGSLAKRCDSKFACFLMLGCALLITIQALINMAVSVNLIPVTGQPLPLISRGGTSVITTCFYFGIIIACSSKLNMKKQENVEETPANVDFGIADEN